MTAGMRVRLGVISLLTAILAAGCLSEKPNSRLQDPDFFCKYMRRVNSRATWVQIRRPNGLLPNDSILTCSASRITLRSRLPFGPEIEWKAEGDAYVATIVENTLEGLDSWKDAPATPDAKVEISSVEGQVFFSRDFMILYGPIRGRMRKPPER